MAYIINRFDGTRLIAVDDGVLDTTTPLGIVGRNYTGWGEVFNENFIFLLENFHGTNPPSRALSGQAWYDSTNRLLKVFNGVSWSAIGNAAVSETEPEITQGGLWLKTTTSQLFVNDGFTWKLVGPEAVENFEITRLVSQTLKSVTGIDVPVIISYIDNQAVSIYSNQSFTIDSNETPVSGFSTLVKGLTFSTDSSIAGRLLGNADTATALETARKINTVSFDGTSDITIKSSTTNLLKKGNYIVGDDWDGEVETTWAIDATPENRIGKIVARDSNGAFSAEEITANFFRGDLNGNVTAVSGNSSFDTITAETVTADLIGNSSTATKLRSARRINTIPFDGTADITLPVPAETLIGTTLATNIVDSSLTTLGKLENLEVDPQGIAILNDNSKLTINLDQSIPTIKSEFVNNIKLMLATGSAQSTSSDISFVSKVASGLSGPSLVPDWNKTVSDNEKINLGTPNNRWNTLYSNNLNSKDLKTLTVSNPNNPLQAVSFLGGIIVAGTVQGNLQGNVTGNVTGNVVGNVTGSASLNVLKSGDTITGDITWSESSRGLEWNYDTDGASIKFFSSGEGDSNTRLEFNTYNNSSEYFLWTHTREDNSKFNLMKLVPNDNFGNIKLSVYGIIESTGNITAAAFIGNGASLTNLTATNITSGTLPIGRLSGSYNINISGTASTATNATFATNVNGGSVNAASGSFTGVLNVSAGPIGGIRFPNDAFGGSGDTASITLESVGGERTRLRFRVTDDPGINTVDDKAEFLLPDSNSLLVNGHIVLNASNYNDYSPTKTGGGASGTWPINITGNANTVNTITASQVVNALGYTPLSSVSTPNNQAGQPIFTGAGSGSGLRFPNDAYGGAFDTATITLETKGGEATRLTLRVTNDADDTIEFFTPARDGVRINNHIVLHAGNWQDYGPNRIGGGASGTWPISITGNANTVSSITAAQVVNALGYTPLSNVAAANNQAGQPIFTGAGSGSGLRFPSNAYGGGGDTATVTLETKGGEATRLTLRVTNDADDTIEFFTPARDGVRANGHIVLHAGNWQDYGPNRTGGGASGTWPINITGNANTVSNISASQIVNALGYTPVRSTAFGGGPINATSGSFSSVLRVSAGGPQSSGIAFPNDAYGGSGDTATITLESVGGERTRLRFRVTNDASASVRDEAEFLVPDNNGLLVNGNVVLHTGNINSFINAGNVKAWVRFRSNGSIISSLNVNSVSRLARGKYRLNINSGVFSSEYFAAAGMASDVDHFVSMNTYSVGGATTTTRLDINTIDASDSNDRTSDSAETMIILVA
jgi:hypothetical protein